VNQISWFSPFHIGLVIQAVDKLIL